MCETSEIDYQKGENIYLRSNDIQHFLFLKNNREVERKLRVKIFEMISKNNKKVQLVIQLTNDNNPTFLYKIVLTKEKYSHLCEKYNLNIEFDKFTSEFINLLDECSSSIKNNEKDQKYKLLLDGYTGTNQGIGGFTRKLESVQMKLIQKVKWHEDTCILILNLKQGSNEELQGKLESEIYELRRYMFSEFKLYQEKLLQLKEEINIKNGEIMHVNFIIDNLTNRIEEEDLNNSDDYPKDSQEFDELITLEKNFRVKECEMDFLTDEELNFHVKGYKMGFLTDDTENRNQETEMPIKKYLENFNNLCCPFHKVENMNFIKFIYPEKNLQESSTFLECFLSKLKNAGLAKTKLTKCLNDSKKELLKSKEIITELQVITRGYTNQIKINQEVISEQELLIKIQEEKLEKQMNLCKKMQEELEKSNSIISELNLQNSILESELHDKDARLNNVFNIVKLIKNNLKDRNLDFKQDLSEQSLLFYRAFLSMPSLLPSDDCRRMDELWYPSRKDSSIPLDHPKKDDNQLTEGSNLIDSYISRYSQRFGSVPTTLFKSSEIPITVLSSPDGALTSQPVFGLPQSIMANGNHQYKDQLLEISKHEQVTVIKESSFQQIPSPSISLSSLSSYFQDNKLEKPIRFSSSESTINSLLADEKMKYFGIKKGSLKHINYDFPIRPFDLTRASHHSGSDIKKLEDKPKIRANFSTILGTPQQRGDNLDALKARRTFSYRSFKSQMSRRSQNSQLSLYMSQDTDSGIFNLLANCNLENLSYSSEQTNKST